MSITYTNPNPDVIVIQNGKEVKKPIISSAYIKFSFDNNAILPSLIISRNGIENTRSNGEDRHRPRIAKMSEIIE